MSWHTARHSWINCCHGPSTYRSQSSFINQTKTKRINRLKALERLIQKSDDLLLCRIIKHWLSASEFRSWTLWIYNGVAVLRGILQDNYYNHFFLFSEALWLLLQSTETLHDIDEAETLLNMFCQKFAAYYGMCINMIIAIQSLNESHKFVSRWTLLCS